MAFKTILVHVDGSSRNTETLQVACDLARTSDAHLAAIYSPTRPLSVPALDAGASVVVALQVDLEMEMQRIAKDMVKQAGQHYGRSIEWREASGSAINNIVLHARHADLVVLTQEDPSGSFALGASISPSVVVAAGRPVLVVPYAGKFVTCGSSVLVAWSGTRESARAVADALPLMKQADVVNVVSFNPTGNSRWGEIPGADIGLWLTRHGVKVNVRQQQSEDVDVGNQILSLASDLSSDLIVMGAYGHSRTLEFVLGGVTRTLLQTMTVPVLMSH